MHTSLSEMLVSLWQAGDIGSWQQKVRSLSIEEQKGSVHDAKGLASAAIARQIGLGPSIGAIVDLSSRIEGLVAQKVSAPRLLIELTIRSLLGDRQAEALVPASVRLTMCLIMACALHEEDTPDVKEL